MFEVFEVSGERFFRFLGRGLKVFEVFEVSGERFLRFLRFLGRGF